MGGFVVKQNKKINNNNKQTKRNFHLQTLTPFNE